MNVTRIFVFAVLMIVFLPTVSFAASLGPYSGAVIDSQTGEPIEGATVLFFWEKRIPTPMEGYSEVFESKLAYTDKNGIYRIPQILANLGLLGMLESTNIIIYQPGYQTYIAMIWHDSPYTKPDPSFRPKDNIVKLDRIPPNFNHREHYEKIDRALGSIREYDRTDPIWGKPLSWEKRKELNLKSGILEKEEILRRAEWEERRGERE